ncbi:hypothetical protein BH10ACT11_BH10ACT11_08310 [soil metagenome]
MDFETKLRPALEQLLDSGEALEGICACSQQRGLFGGGSVALGISDRRLIVQPLDMRGNPKGEATMLTPAEIASAKVDGAGGDWIEISSVVLDYAAVKLTLRTVGGEKLRLMMMRGDTLGALGADEGQRRGLEALSAWFARADRD